MNLNRTALSVALFGACVVAGQFFLPTEQPTDLTNHVKVEIIRTGDLLLFRSETWRSTFVQLIQGSSQSAGHIGIAEVIDGRVSVIHADPRTFEDNGRDGVRVDELGTLIERYNIRSLTVARVTDITEQAAAAAVAARGMAEQGFVFDHSFDMSSGREIYCTELVYLAYGAESGPFKEVAFRSKYFYPMNVFVAEGVSEVFTFNSEL